MNDVGEIADDEWLFRAQTPHAKEYMPTKFGRLVERVSYLDIVIAACFVLASSTAWYALGPHGHEVNGAPLSLLEAGYYALAVFTSLGDETFEPIGFGRAVAMFVAVAGLFLTAIFIGKIASERQSSMMLLLHTSDTQRRISQFSRELREIRGALSTLADEKKVTELREALDSHLRLVKALGSYIMFNAHQAAVAEYGNFTALSGLYGEIHQSFNELHALHRKSLDVGDATVMRRVFENMKRLNLLAARMSAVHHHRKIRDPLWRVVLVAIGVLGPAKLSISEQRVRERIAALQRFTSKRIIDEQKWVSEGYHPIQIERVSKELAGRPRATWPKGIHKTIATKLLISNNVASRCIDHIVRQRTTKTDDKGLRARFFDWLKLARD